MTMQQLVSCYGHKLPVIVSVVDGFFGCYGNEIGSEEMFWICDVARQKRILVRDKLNRYYSIPIDYQLQFHMLSGTNEKTASLLSLREVMSLLASTSLPLIMLKDDQPVTFGTGGGGGGGGAKRSTTTFARLGALEIIDAYELQYLQAHSIYESKMDPRTTSIPVFLDLSFVVAVGCLHGNDDDFRRWMAKVNAIGRKLIGQSTPVTCNEIIFLDHLPESSSVDRSYEFVKPRNLVLTHIEHQYEHIISSSFEGDDPPDAAPETTTTIQTDTVVDNGVAASLPPLPMPAESFLPGNRGTGGGNDFVERERSGRGGTEESSSPPPIPERRTGKTSTTLKKKKKTRSPPPSLLPPPPPSPSDRAPSDSSHDVPVLGSSQTPSGVFGATESESQRRLIPTNDTRHQASTTEGASSSSLAVTSPSATSGDDETCTLRRYLFASDVPRDLDFRSLSKADVAHCLCLLDLWQCGLAFEALDINGALLLELNEDILIADLGFTARGARKLMRFAKDKWRPSKARNH